MNLAGYIRVSTEGQVDAFGKEVQQDGIQRAADLLGHTITEWVEEDAVSGTIDGGDRPKLSELLTRADQFDGIMVFDATRIARRFIVQETLLALVWAHGLAVFSSVVGELDPNEDEPTKILIRQILGVIAEFDHRTTVKKLQAGRLAKSAQGGYIGGTTPYGIMAVGTGKAAELFPYPVESMVVREIVARHGNGESMRSIAGGLNLRGVPTKKNKTWTATQVSRVLTRGTDDRDQALHQEAHHN